MTMDAFWCKTLGKNWVRFKNGTVVKTEMISDENIAANEAIGKLINTPDSFPLTPVLRVKHSSRDGWLAGPIDGRNVYIFIAKEEAAVSAGARALAQQRVARDKDDITLDAISV